MSIVLPKLRDARSNREIVHQAIVDLTNANRAVSRQVVSQHAGLKLSIVDDHISRMIDDGVLRRVVNGVVELAHNNANDRPVSMTYLPRGGCKLEIGDTCIDLTMREAWMLSMAAGGVGLTFAR